MIAASAKSRPRSAKVLARLAGSKLMCIGYCSYNNRTRQLKLAGCLQKKPQDLTPSKIAEERRQTLSADFHALRLPEGGTPSSALLFRGSRQLEANAFTLPDGTIIVLDDLITSIDDDQQTLAVLAHELGHAHGHHGLQLLLQSSAVGAFVTFYVGDISHLLAVAPAAVVQARDS